MDLGPPPEQRVPRAEAAARLEKLRQAAQARREADLECARQLAWFWEHAAWYEAGCACPAQLAERCALDGDDARGLTDLGIALRADPRLEDEVRTGRMSTAGAIVVASALANPVLQRPGDDWLNWGRTLSVRALRRHLHRRREEARSGGEPVYPLGFYVRERGLENFKRARVLASREVGEALTRGATFEYVMESFVEAHDPNRVAPGTRRTPPTHTVAGRYIPAEVRREVRSRGKVPGEGERCAVPLCPNTIYLQYAHVVAHTKGGDREADNLLLLCTRHHRMLDAGLMKFVGTVDAPVFLDREGHPIGPRFGWTRQHVVPPSAVLQGNGLPRLGSHEASLNGPRTLRSVASVPETHARVASRGRLLGTGPPAADGRPVGAPRFSSRARPLLRLSGSEPP